MKEKSTKLSEILIQGSSIYLVLIHPILENIAQR